MHRWPGDRSRVTTAAASPPRKPNRSSPSKSSRRSSILSIRGTIYSHRSPTASARIVPNLLASIRFHSPVSNSIFSRWTPRFTLCTCSRFADSGTGFIRREILGLTKTAFDMQSFFSFRVIVLVAGGRREARGASELCISPMLSPGTVPNR